VHRAVLFIEPRLFEPLRSDDVANAVGGSVYQLHRQFTDVYGVSLAAYIRARRLSEAARMLRDPAADVLSVALRCQYGSQAAFTRAFRKQFGVPPGAFRSGQGALHAAVSAATVQELLHRDQLDRTPTLRWLHQDRPLLGLDAVVDPTRLSDFVAVQDALVDAIGSDHQAVGVATGTSGLGLGFFLGVDVDRVPPGGLARGRLQAGLYAVFRHRGPADRVRHSIAFFAQTWAPGEGQVTGRRPDAEVFSLAERDADTLSLELWLAVDPADPRD
jgi:AraC family transcriptional regulator